MNDEMQRRDLPTTDRNWNDRTIPVIIPFYKDKAQLDRCLLHLQQQTFTSIETYIRDNTLNNIYYTAAVNEGFREYAHSSSVKYILVLTQDVYLEKSAIEALHCFMESQPQCGIACPLQVFARDRRQVYFGGGRGTFPSGMHKRGKIDDYKEPQETPWANGACMMIRTDLIKEVGLFDSNMRFIYSDVDFSFWARARGWKIWVVPSAVAAHEVGASGTETTEPTEIDLVMIADSIHFAKKWLTGDLYQALAADGPTLTKLSVKWEVANLQASYERVRYFLKQARAPADVRVTTPGSVALP